MFALFVCYNPISYHIAQRVIRHEHIRRAMVLWDSKRFGRVPGAAGWHLPMGARSHQFIHLLSSWGLISAAYVPHMRVTIRRLHGALMKVRHTYYLDDGLDTLRRVPRNFDVTSLVPGRRYYTFREYEALPEWLKKLEVIRVGNLTDLWAQGRPGVPFPPGSRVLVESPGVQIEQHLADLRGQGIDPIVVRHPVKAKQANFDAQGLHFWQGSGNLDADIAMTRGAHFYMGETMSLVVALLGPAKGHNTWQVQLSMQQRENLFFLLPKYTDFKANRK